MNKRENIGLKHFHSPKSFIEYSNDMQDVYKNINEYNEDKERKILMVFDDIIADMNNNKKLVTNITNKTKIVTSLFSRGRKLNISLVFITQSYFKVSKDVRRNSTHFSL